MRCRRSGPDEGDVLDGAAGLGEAGSRQLLCACHVVRPAAETQRVQCPRFNKQKMLADDEFFL